MTGRRNTDDLDESLRRLVVDARGGKAASYRTLLETLTPVVRRRSAALLVRCGQSGMTEDVTQEVLLAVHCKLHTYDEGLSFMAWAMAVTRHKVIDALRRNKMPITSIDAPDFVEPAAPEDPHAQTARNDLEKLLSQLKPPAGDIIYALKIEGVTVRELASRHQTSEANIKVIVHRGLQKLSALVAREETASR